MSNATVIIFASAAIQTVLVSFGPALMASWALLWFTIGLGVASLVLDVVERKA